MNGIEADRPKVFIGSSEDKIEFAHALQTNLDRYADCTAWDQDVFQLTRHNLDSLLRVSDQFDFAVFICANDDLVHSRDRISPVPRDNVILELGIFIGKLGPERVFFICPRGSQAPRIPTDLAGIAYAHFDVQRPDPVASLGPASNQIARAIRRLGPFRDRPVFAPGHTQIKFAAGICYRFKGDEIQFLLVNSTRSRKIFPKGKIKSGEDPANTALRFSHDEGGVLGVLRSRELLIFRHAKEMLSEEQNIIGFLIEVHGRVDPVAEFRNPEWYDQGTAERIISQGRNFEYAEEMRKVFRNAVDIIKTAPSTVEQAAAVPYRRTPGGLEILLITSKRSRRWILPKGHISSGVTPFDAAATEAREEAGVCGRVEKRSFGEYNYWRFSAEYRVQLFPLEVATLLDDWPEADIRERRWVPVEMAETMVIEEDLKEILVRFSQYMRLPDRG